MLIVHIIKLGNYFDRTLVGIGCRMLPTSAWLCFGWCIRMAHCGEATGRVFKTKFFRMVVLLLPWVGVTYVFSRFCVVTTMPAVRGGLGCAKSPLCFLLVVCSDVNISHIVLVMVMWWCSPQVLAIRQLSQPLLV